MFTVTKKCLLGLYLLLQSPSGLFSLLTLAAITLVTLKAPSVGGTAFTAFCAVIPGILAWVEHKETLAQIVPMPLPPDANLPQKGSP